MSAESEVSATSIRILFGGGGLRAEGVVGVKPQPARSNKARVLRALITGQSIPWMRGFLLLPTWCKRTQTTKTYAEQFETYAHEAARLLRDCLGPQSPRVDEIGVEKDATSAWRLFLPIRHESNAGKSDALLDAAKTAFCKGPDEATAWRLIREAFAAVNDDSTVIDAAKLLDALQFAGDGPANGVEGKDLRDRIENLLSLYNVQLALAILKTVCLAHEELLGITPQIAQAFVPGWAVQLSQARECLALLKRVRGTLPSVAGADVDRFVDAANDCRRMLRELKQIPESAPERRLAAQEAVEKLAQILTTDAAVQVRDDTKKYFSIRQHQGVTDKDVDTHFGPAMQSCIDQYPCDFWPNRELLEQVRSFVRRYVWRQRHDAGEFLHLYALPGGDERVAAEIRAMLDHVRNRRGALAAVREILKSFPRSRPELSPAGAIKQLQEHLRQNARLKDEQAGEQVPAPYIPLKLQREVAVEAPEVTAGRMPELGADIPHMVRVPFDPHDLVSPATNYVLVGPSGSGKTTLLRHLWSELLTEEGRIAVYLRAVELARLLTVSPNAPLACLARLLRNGLKSGLIRSACERAAEHQRLVILVDQLEGVEAIGITPAAFLKDVVSLLGGIRIIAAAREPEAHWAIGLPGFARVRLLPFDLAAREQFFGDSHHEAVRLSRGDLTLLSHPMHAALVKSLVSSGEAKLVRSRWALYTRVLQHRLYQHEPSLRADLRAWPYRLRGISHVAYVAIARSRPFFECVPNAFWTRLAPLDEIKALSQAGVVGLEFARTDTLEPDLVFAHRSFQEYFAAYWASLSDGRTRALLQEYWNPKWHEVIRFIAGAKPIVRHLYGGEMCDDALHARLFLAAECVKEEGGKAPTVTRILTDLRKCAQEFIFQPAAVRAMILVGTKHALHCAWQTLGRLPSTHWRSVLADSWLADRMFSERRLRWVITHLRTPYSTCAAQALIAWRFHLSADLIEEVIAGLALSNWDAVIDSTAVLVAIGHQLNQRHLDALVDLATETDGIGNPGMGYVFAYLRLVLAQDRLEYIIDRLGAAPQPLLGAAREAFTSIADFLQVRAAIVREAPQAKVDALDVFVRRVDEATAEQFVEDVQVHAMVAGGPVDQESGGLAQPRGFIERLGVRLGRSDLRGLLSELNTLVGDAGRRRGVENGQVTPRTKTILQRLQLLHIASAVLCGSGLSDMRATDVAHMGEAVQVRLGAERHARAVEEIIGVLAAGSSKLTRDETRSLVKTVRTQDARFRASLARAMFRYLRPHLRRDDVTLLLDVLRSNKSHANIAEILEACCSVANTLQPSERRLIIDMIARDTAAMRARGLSVYAPRFRRQHSYLMKQIDQLASDMAEAVEPRDPAVEGKRELGSCVTGVRGGADLHGKLESMRRLLELLDAKRCNDGDTARLIALLQQPFQPVRQAVYPKLLELCALGKLH